MPKSNEVSLKEALRDLVDAFHLKPKLYQSRLPKIWQAKMGATITAHTTELKLRERTLFITIKSASLKQELMYARDKIADMLNAELGENYIEKVVIR
jgi:predicted nucleic acid-binding Zn ribbon protein